MYFLYSLGGVTFNKCWITLSILNCYSPNFQGFILMKNALNNQVGMLGDMFLWLVANLKQGVIYFIKQGGGNHKIAWVYQRGKTFSIKLHGTLFKKLFWANLRKNIVLVIEIWFLANSRPWVLNLQTSWHYWNKLFEQFFKQNDFSNHWWRFTL